VSVCHGLGPDALGDAPLEVEHGGAHLAVLHALASVNGLHVSPVPLRAPVVQVGHQFEPIPLEPDHTVVVHEVGLQLVDQVLEAQKVLLLP